MSKEKLINNDINQEHQEFSKKIGDYILLDQIGQGTFSKVTRAFHIPSEQIVAVKILNKEQIEDEIDMERINREIEILKNIYHPNICQIYETYSTIHNYYLMMEYIEDGDLFDYISEKSFLSESKACYFFRQLISVMEYLSSLGICHRDIKPENILLTDNYSQIKVIDFGLSNFCENNELLHSSCGSPCYAPPEMLMGEKYNGLGTDIWSAGIVLYSMLVGALPFDDVELKSLYKQIKEGKFYIPSTLSLEAIDLLKQILRVDPEKRITIKEIKKHKWFNLEQNVMYKGVNIYIDKMPCDIEVIKYVMKNYFPQDNNISLYNFVNMVKGYSCNKYTATYYLVKKYVLKKEDINEKENEIINDNYKKVYKEIKETKEEINNKIKNNKIKNNKSNKKVIIKRNLENNSSNFYDYDDSKGNISVINNKNNHHIFFTAKNNSQNKINKNNTTIVTDNKDKEKQEQKLNNEVNNNKIKIKRKKKEKNVVLIGQQNLKNDKKNNQKNKVIKKPDDKKIGLKLGFSLINIVGMNEKSKIPESITERNVAEKCRFSNYINKIYSSTNTNNTYNNNSNSEIRIKSAGKKNKKLNTYLNKVISPKKDELNYFYVINNIINKDKLERKKRTKNELFNLEINSNLNRQNYLTSTNNENIIVNINNNNYINNSMNRHFQNLSLENSNQLLKQKEIKSKIQSPKNDNNKNKTNNNSSHIKVNLKSSKEDLKYLTSPKNKNPKRNKENNSSKKKKFELNIFSNKIEKINTSKKRNTEKASPSTTIHYKINRNNNKTSNIVKYNTNILCKKNNIVKNKVNKNVINKEKIKQTVINHRKIKSLYNEKNMLFDYFSDNKNKKNKNHKRNISSVFHFYLSDNKNDLHLNYMNTISNNKKIDEINENNYTVSYSEEKRVKNKILNKPKNIGQKKKTTNINLNNNNNDLNSFILDKLKRNKLLFSHNISQTKNNKSKYFVGLNQPSSSNNYYLIDNIQKINKIKNDTYNISLNNPK